MSTEQKLREALRAATHLQVDAEVRYWEDAEINGTRDDDGSLIPCRIGASWKPLINLAEGRVEEWPSGTVADIYYKVCDQGEYWLSDASGTRIAKWRGHYVPDDFLCHGDNGFGDYIILNVDDNGFIAGYRIPKIDPDRWQLLPSPPQPEDAA